MLQEICVAWDDTPHARWAVEFAGLIARRAGARVTLVHVAAPVETELIDLGEAGRPRRTLAAAAASLPRELVVRERLLAGRAAEQLAAAATRSDLLVAGTRPLRGGQRLACGTRCCRARRVRSRSCEDRPTAPAGRLRASPRPLPPRPGCRA
jgi:nucleotide-binding universal stress UspA family protein